MEGSEAFESPGEALLFLLGLPVFALLFVVFVILGSAGVSSRDLIPLSGLAQIGLLMQATVEWRITRRLYPNSGWREALRHSRSVRRELWRLETFRRAAGIVARNVSGAVQAAFRDHIVTPRWIGLSMILVGANMAILFALS